MSTFIERHPSLKGWSMTIKKYEEQNSKVETEMLVNNSELRGASYLPDMDSWEFIPTHIVDASQLDKQKVREVIDKYFGLPYFHKTASGDECHQALDKFMKELGI